MLYVSLLLQFFHHHLNSYNLEYILYLISCIFYTVEFTVMLKFIILLTLPGFLREKEELQGRNPMVKQNITKNLSSMKHHSLQMKHGGPTGAVTSLDCSS